MTTRHLVDPELLPIFDLMPAIEFSRETLAQVRAARTLRFALARKAELPGVAVSEHDIPGPAGAPDLRVLVYTPALSPTPVPALLHIHGGGYVIGAPEMNAISNRLLARDVGCVIVSVDYRLAPDAPFPAGVEDCYAALKWLHGHAAELGVDAGRIAIGGQSAGGGLTATLALLARDRGEVPVAFQWLIYPMLDDRTGLVGDLNPHAGEFVWTKGHNRFGWDALLGTAAGGPDVSPYAAAARAPDLAGLPPAFIATGALDLLADENIDYAQRLLRAGVPTELHVYPGAVHGFELVAEALVSKAFERDCRAALRRALF